MLLAAELVALVALVVTHVVLQRRLTRLFERDEARRVALYKQQKASERTVQQSDRAVRKMVDQMRHLHDDARQLHGRVDRHVSNLKKGGADG